MPPDAISFASTCAPLLAALGVELPKMTGNIVSLSAHDSNTRRQALAMEIEQATHGQSRWSWDYLLRAGRPYLAKFLWRVRATPIPQAEEEDSEDVEDTT